MPELAKAKIRQPAITMISREELTKHSGPLPSRTRGGQQMGGEEEEGGGSRRLWVSVGDGVYDVTGGGQEAS